MTVVAEHRYAPRGTAKELFGIRDAEVLVSGPAGTGKSRACLEKLHRMALKYPNMRGLIVRKTFTSLSSSALDTWRKFVIKEALEVGDVVAYGGGSLEPPQFRYTNGSAILMAGMDKATRIMSSEYDVIYVQEATELTIEDWEMLCTRLRNYKVPYQQIIADANPNTPTHWIKQRCDKGTTKMLNSKHEENPTLFDADGNVTNGGREYIGKLDSLTGVRKERLRFGKWLSAEGTIYDEYDSTVHLIDRFDIPNEWTRYWAIDFGTQNPFVCQWWAEDHDGRLYLYREIYRTHITIDQHARDILSQVKVGGNWIEPRPRTIITDHDLGERMILERELGLGTVAANKQVMNGIQAVQQRLRLQPDGKPRIFILRDSLVSRDNRLVDAKKPTCTQEEIVGYVWDTGTGKAPKEQPLKQDDHGCDAMRYMVAEQDLSSRPNIRWF